MRRIYYNIMYIFACVWCLTACVGEELDGAPSAGKGKGLLRLSIGKVDATVKGEVETKANISGLAETTDNFWIDFEPKIAGFPKQFKEVKNGIELPSGTYTVSAYAGKSDGVLTDKPYFLDSKPVVISTTETPTVELNPSLANAMLEFDGTENMGKYYTAWTLTAIAGSESKALASNDAPFGRLFVKAGVKVDVELSATNNLNKPVMHTQPVTTSAEAKTGYFITYDPNWSAFNKLSVKVNGVHTKSSDGYLNGTNVTLDIENANGVDLDAIEYWNIQLSYQGTVIRTFTGSGNPTGKPMEAVANWAYVPQGCTATASFTLKSGDEYKDVRVERDIPLPEVSAEVIGETSYSVYTKSGAAAANETDGSSIWGVTATAKISPEILSKYPDLLEPFSYKVDGKESSEVSPTFSDLSWGALNLEATATFDGGTVLGSKVCHVTGLPYRGEYTKEKPNFGQGVKSWILVGNDGGVYTPTLGGEFGYTLFHYYGSGVKENNYVFSPAFQFPAKVKAYYATKVVYFTGGLGNPDIIVYTGVGANTETKIINKSTTIRCTNSDLYPADKKYTLIEDNVELENNYRICISHNEKVVSNLGNRWLIFKNLDVLYR